MSFKTIFRLSAFGLLLTAGPATRQMTAQNLTLEGQTGGFITPTAYVVESAKGHVFSHPVVGYHFINSHAVIGDIHTVSILEGFSNRAEVGYTRSIHTDGDSALLSRFWNTNGMNIFNAKAVAIKDGQFGPWTPGLAGGFVVRTGDRFVSGNLNQLLLGASKTYTNGDVYAVATKSWLHPPVPFIVNLGWKATNASIYGIGGQSTRFSGELFGGLGIPLPGPFHTAIAPAVGFTQEPPNAVHLNALLPGGTHLPTTLDYAVRITQKEHAHFSLDLGIGQVAGQIGTTYVQIPGTTLIAPVLVNLEARHVFGMGLSIRP